MSHLSYRDLIHQTYDFPQLGFDVNKAGNLVWNGVDLLQQVKESTPVKISYLPKIREKIQYANKIFNSAIEKYFYDGNYIYSYCTKSSHFEFVLDQVISEGAQLELSSEFDIEIIEKLATSGKLKKETLIVCNGYKPAGYLKKIVALKRKGYDNLVVIIDNTDEIDDLDAILEDGEICKIGMRVATEDEPNTDIYTSRLGTRSKDILPIYKDKIHNNKKFELCALHFFINTKIKDTSYYWSELSRITGLYCDLKRFSKTLQYLDIGGGFPMPSSLNFEYDYEYIADQIIWTIKHVCESEEIQVPDIVTEFGTYTVGESGATIFKVLGQKKQNDKELRYMIDSSLITTLPDIRGINQKFIVLPINGWDNDYEKVIIGGITCDNDDFYNKDAKGNQIILPSFDENQEDLYIGFFHTGAYQESLGGYGGIQHCLIPAPKHILIDVAENGSVKVEQFSKQQESKSMLGILGYKYFYLLLPYDMVTSFDPNAPALEGRLFGLPFSIEESTLVIVPVPVDMTTSSGKGTSHGPQMVLEASTQVDLYDLQYKNFREKGIAMLPIDDSIVQAGDAAIAQSVIDNLAQGQEPFVQDLQIVNQASEKINTYVYTQTKKLLDAGKKVALLGGDHSTPYGFVKALSEVHSDFAILQMDAHCDLRKGYEGFTYSHASIAYNIMETIPQVSKLVQVGIRDFCEEEQKYIVTHADRVTVHFDRDIQQALYAGKNWAAYARMIVDQLPQNVYISFDIDALDPKLCPHTGTPVPGGLEFEQAAMLLDMVAQEKNIIAFDLNEVGNDVRDANVGARMLFRLCAQLLSSQD